MSIKRGTFPFIKVAQTGELDDKGKVALSVGYSGRIVAGKEKPLAGIAERVIEMMLPHVFHESEEHANADLKALRDYVGKLSYGPVGEDKPKKKMRN